MFSPLRSLLVTRVYRTCLAVSVALASVTLLAVVGKAAPQEDLGARIEEAKESFKPVSEKQVDQARSELQSRMRELEQFVQPSSQNGQRWLKYLHWDTLKQEVGAKDSKNYEALDVTLAKLNRNVNGLEGRRFRRLARALRRYRDTLAVSTWGKPNDIYNQQLDALQKDLDAYHKEPTSQNAASLSQRIRIIDSIGQAPKLVEAVRDDLARPNAFVTVSTSYLAAGADPVDRCDPVTDCILGTTIHGDAHTVGSVGVASIPSKDKAVLEFISHGHVWSNNTGYNGPAVIRSTADTDYTARARVEFSDAAFKAESSNADARTDTHIHSVSKAGGGLGSRLVSRVGFSRAMQSEGQAEAIASDHAEDRIERRFDDEVGDKLSDARKRYEDDYRKPLERRGELPDTIRFSSTKNALAFEVVQANRSQLGAQGAPPEAASNHDVTAKVHETAVNNYSAALLAGATAKQTKADEDIKFDVEVPKWMDTMWKHRKTESTNDPNAKAEPFQPFTMTLSDVQPVTVKFAGDNKVQLTLHIAELQSGDNHFSNWDVTGTYESKIADGRIELTRQGKLEMLPADFHGKLDAQQVAERNNLEKEFDKRSAQGTGFPKSIEFDPVKPEGDLANAGPLEYREFSVNDGWLVAGLDRQPKQAKHGK